MNKVSKLLASAGATATLAQVAVLNVFAQREGLDQVSGTSSQGGDLIGFVTYVINLAIGLAGLAAVAVLVYSGFQYIAANGDEAKVEKATQGIIYAVVGLVVALISVLIVNFVLDRVLGV